MAIILFSFSKYLVWLLRSNLSKELLLLTEYLKCALRLKQDQCSAYQDMDLTLQ